MPTLAAQLSKDLADLLLTDPDNFMQQLASHPDYTSLETAEQLDKIDPLGFTSNMFAIDKLTPFAGHSFGPPLKATEEGMHNLCELQKQLHAGHFPHSHPKGQQSGHWLHCDREEDSLKGAQQLLGFKEMHEFNFTNSGLSQNLGMVMDNFYAPSDIDWKKGKSKIVMLATEFFSDQAIVTAVMNRTILRAENGGVFKNLGMKTPIHQKEIMKIKSDRKGLYDTQKIIDYVKKYADKIDILCLPGIVFNTGQRLDLDKIFQELGAIIKTNKIKVILDLAHTVGNRFINLDSMPITAAVGCAYKHLSGPAGSSFGIYVSRNADLKKYPPIQGWGAADTSKVFGIINSYDASIMDKKNGATAFRTSNPPPLALLPAQTYVSEFGKIGFTKCFNKSECLTRYLILQLQRHLADRIEIITSLDPKARGATIAVRMKGGEKVEKIEAALKDAGFEVDSRPPSIIRMTAHYGYIKFADIQRFVTALKQILAEIPVVKVKPEIILPDSDKYYTHYTPEEDNGRWHFFKAQHNKHWLDGDALKSNILDSFKVKLEKCSNLAELDNEIEAIKKMEDYHILGKAQGITTKLLGLKTSSITAFEAMCTELKSMHQSSEQSLRK